MYVCICNCRLQPPKEIFYRNSVTFMTVLPPPTMPKRCSCVYLCTGAKATIKCLSCAIYDPNRVGYFCDACFKVNNIGPYHYRFRCYYCYHCYYWHQVASCLYCCFPSFLPFNQLMSLLNFSQITLTRQARHPWYRVPHIYTSITKDENIEYTLKIQNR